MSAVAKIQIESQVVDRLGQIFERPEKRPPEILPTGINEIDKAFGGWPRGAITEIHGAASCGRTSVLLSALAASTSSEETCALVDCSGTFDLSSAMHAGVDFNWLLWIRCGDDLECAFKAVDLLLHSGGFGFIVLNLADMPAKTLRRIISTWWFRFRRAIENTPTVLMVTTPVSCARSGAAMALELKRETALWPSSRSFARGDNRAATLPSECVSSHLSLVPANDRPASPSSVINHSHLLQTATVRVFRERPLTGSTHPVRFASHICHA